MNYEAPDFLEIKMDAEISSYQDDFDPTQDPAFVRDAGEAAVAAPADASR